MRQDYFGGSTDSMSSWSNITGRRTFDAPGEHTTFNGYKFPWTKYNPVCKVMLGV